MKGSWTVESLSKLAEFISQKLLYFEDACMLMVKYGEKYWVEFLEWPHSTPLGPLSPTKIFGCFAK